MEFKAQRRSHGIVGLWKHGIENAIKTIDTGVDELTESFFEWHQVTPENLIRALKSRGYKLWIAKQSQYPIIMKVRKI